MSNIIQFPMDRVRLSPIADEFFDSDYAIAHQSIDLEKETLQILEQAKAIEEQSRRILDLMTDLENY